MLLSAGLALAVSACSFSASVGSPVVKKADLEQQISDQLEAQTKERPKSLECPGDLAGKVGQTMRCTVTDGTGTAFGLTVTVSTVKDDKISFDLKVDDAPASSLSAS